MERRMTRAHKTFCRWVLLFCFACLPARAQNVEFLPEVDAHLKLNSNVRVYFEDKNDRDGGDPTQFTFCPSIQLYLKPFIKLTHVTALHLYNSHSTPSVLDDDN